ncbi:MAG TPA: TolC family outer membrane protein [Cellvibrio sp.]|nr:TolC family outer membrane protein [Cellvibrio sp.]
MMNLRMSVKPGIWFGVTLFGCLTAQAVSAQTANNLHDAVIQAIELNPDVQASWHTFKSSAYQVREARAGYLPSVDLAVSGSNNSRDYDNRDRYNSAQGQISLTQMLFDGFRVSGQVDHLEEGRLTRYFELLDTVESTAFEAVRAYEDVSRERELVALARDNYAKHQEVYSQIESRVNSGVGRKVDLEQVAGRLALAETNLLTESSNLHDVTARYLRVVGTLPGGELAPTKLSDSQLPANIRETLNLAYQGNPGFHAAIKNIAAAQANVKVERSGYYPKAELRARQNISRNSNGFDERFDPDRYGEDNAVELSLTYNLYKGGGTRAAVRRSLEDVNYAKDLRDKACVDLRQNTQIAFNDSQRLKEQLFSLDQHRLSSDKVRNAYNEQFKIGQRTLLDMLDAENEYFEASRAYASGLSSLNIAHARTLVSMGGLLKSLDITRENLAQVKDANVDGKVHVDSNSACPVDVNEPLTRKDLIAERIHVEPAVVARLNSDALFDVGSSVITAKSIQKLDSFIAQIKATPSITRLKVEGHTDNTGSDKVNIPLSQARALRVHDYLVANGLDNLAIEYEGFGSTRPVGDNTTPQGRSENRRVDITSPH